MVNIIWAVMTIVGIVYALINGTLQEVNEAVFASANEAVTLTISLLSVLVFWLGLMKIAEKSGLLQSLTYLFKPFLRKLFPELPRDSWAIDYILANFIANLFGLGNAATPMGIKAMEEMKRLSDSDTATRSMITFLAINTSSVTLIPTTVIAIRLQYDSANPTEIVATTIMASMIAFISAVTIDRLFAKFAKKE